MSLLQRAHFHTGIVPLADFGDGGFNSDIVSMGHYTHCTFLVHMGANAGGAQTFTVDACSNVSAGATNQVDFYWRKVLTSFTADVHTDATLALAATGILMTTAANQIFVIEVTAAAVAAANGYEYVRLTGAETTNAAITGGVMIVLSGGRYQGDDVPTAIT